MKPISRRSMLAMSGAATLGAGLAACSSDDSDAGVSKDGTIELTFSGWNVTQAPEFETLAKAFTAKHPKIKIKVVEYDAAKYHDQMIADLAAKKGPDIITVKNLATIYDYIKGKALLDVTDIGRDCEKTTDIKLMETEGKYYGIPLRFDHYLMYYNVNLLKSAGVPAPDGKWTWDDFDQMAIDLTKKINKPNVMGSFIMNWPGLVQGFALAQTPGANDASGKLDYLKPYYERALDLQDKKGCQTFATVQSQTLHYRSEFGAQKAALVPIGTWFMGMMQTNQKTGTAQKFPWALCPVPQRDSSTFSHPRTYGAPTPAGINSRIAKGKVDAAKEFLTFLASEEATMALAKVGVVGPYRSEKTADALFSQPGMPTDKVSKEAFNNAKVHLEWTLNPNSPKILNVMLKAHSAIMTESVSIDEGIKNAENELRSNNLVSGQ